MLCLDDYFMVETEKMVEDPETRKKTKKMVWFLVRVMGRGGAVVV